MRVVSILLFYAWGMSYYFKIEKKFTKNLTVIGKALKPFIFVPLVKQGTTP